MNSGIKITSLWQINGGDTQVTQKLTIYGPITAYVYASTFQLCTSGVFSDPACNGKTKNHAGRLWNVKRK